jgi:hypothetical protein
VNFHVFDFPVRHQPDAEFCQTILKFHVIDIKASCTDALIKVTVCRDPSRPMKAFRSDNSESRPRVMDPFENNPACGPQFLD